MTVGCSGLVPRFCASVLRFTIEFVLLKIVGLDWLTAQGSCTQEPVPQSRLADHPEMERTTLYRALAVLDKQGLLSLSAGARGPSKAVSLTEAGESLVEAARKTWSQLHEGYLHRFGEDGLEQLNSLLAEVRDFSHHIFTRS